MSKKWLKSGCAFLLALSMVFGAAGQYSSTVEAASTTITPSEFVGFEEGDFTHDASNTLSTNGTYLGDLKDTILDMNVKFGENSTKNDFITFASADGWTGVRIHMEKSGTTTKLVVSNTTNSTKKEFFSSQFDIALGEEFNLKIETTRFQKSGTRYNLTMKFTVAGKAVSGSTSFNNLNGVGKNLAVYCAAEESAISVKTPGGAQNTYTNLTTLDFIGMSNGTFTHDANDGLSAQGTYMGDLNKTTTSMDVTFGTSNTFDDFITYGSSTGWGGIRIFMYNESGREVLVFKQEEGATTQYAINCADYCISLGQEFNLKLRLNQSGLTAQKRTVALQVFVNDQKLDINPMIFEGVPNTGASMGVYCKYDTSSITVKAPNGATKEYTNITPLDFVGMNNGTYTKDPSNGLSAKGMYMKDLNQTCISMDVTFGENNTFNDYIAYGNKTGWEGIRIFMYNESGTEVLVFQQIQDTVAQYAYNCADYGIQLGKEFNLKIYVDEGAAMPNGKKNLGYQLEINGIKVKTPIIFESVPNLGSHMGVYCSSETSSIAINAPGDLEKSYTRVTPADLDGFLEGTIGPHVTNGLGTMGTSSTKLDQAYLDMDITFGENNSFGDYIGLTSDDGWHGPRLTMYYEESRQASYILLMDGPAGGNQYAINASQYGADLGKQFNFKIYLDRGELHPDGTQDIAIQLKINDVLVTEGPFIFRNMVQLGDIMSVYCDFTDTNKKGRITVRTPGTEDEHVYVTPSDFEGFRDGTYEMTAHNGLSQEGISPVELDSNCIDMDVVFNEKTTFHDYITVASADGWSGLRISMFYEPSHGTNFLLFKNTANDKEFALNTTYLGIGKNQEFNLKLFIMKGKMQNGTQDLMFRVAINGGIVGTVYMDNKDYFLFEDVANLGNRMSVYCSNEGAKITVKTPGTYLGLIPTDFEGMKDGTYSYNNGEAAVSGVYDGDLEDTYIDSNLTFGADNTADDYITVAGKDATTGIRIAMCDDAGTEYIVFRDYEGNTEFRFPAADYDAKLGEELNLKLYVNKGYKDTADKRSVYIKALINGKEVGSDAMEFPKVPDVGSAMGIYCAAETSSITLDSPIPANHPLNIITQKTPEQLGYKQVRPVDFYMEDGIYNPNYKDGQHIFDMYKDGDSVNKKYLDVNLTFYQDEEKGTDDFVNFGSADGWHGIRIGVHKNTLRVHLPDSYMRFYTAKELGLNSLYEEFNMKVGAQYKKTGDTYTVTYDLWINDVRVTESVTVEGISEIGGGFSIYTPNRKIKMTSPASKTGEQSKPSGKKEQLNSSFRKLTFASFRIKDNTYKFNNFDLAAYGEFALTLDKTVFSTDIEMTDGGDIRYGGKSNEWCGLYFYVQSGRLHMRGVEGDTETYTFNSMVAGTDLIRNTFNLKISMEFVALDSNQKKDDIKVGVWFNDVLYDNKYIYLNDYKQYIGSLAAINVNAVPSAYVKVKSDSSVDTGVDFTLYGFTKNWEKELGI